MSISMSRNTPIRPSSPVKNVGNDIGMSPIWKNSPSSKVRSLSPIKGSSKSPSKVDLVDASKRHKHIVIGPTKLNDIFISSSDGTDYNQLESPLQQKNASFIRKKLQKKDIVIMVEHCFDCEKHNSLSLRHDQSQYFTKSKNIIREAARAIHACSLNIRCGVIRIPVLAANRLGACEVVILYRDNDNKLHDEVILHSKLESGLWPDASAVIKNIVDFVNEKRIATFNRDFTEDDYIETSDEVDKNPCPSGFKDFDDIEIGDHNWLSSNDDFGEIEWVFDSRQSYWNTEYIFELRKIFGKSDISTDLVNAIVSDENKSNDNRPVPTISYDTVYSYSVKYNSLKHICGEMTKSLIKDNKILGLRAELTETDAFIEHRRQENEEIDIKSTENDSFTRRYVTVEGTDVDAIIIPNETNNSSATIKFKIRFFSDSYALEIENYGRKVISFGTPDGTVFNEFELLLIPSSSLRAPCRFLYFNKLTNDLIIENINITFKRKSAINRKLFTDDKFFSMKMSLSVDAINGELELPTQIDEGLWSSLIAIKGFEDLESKTFLYLSDVPIDSMIEKIMLRPKLIISNTLKTNLDDQLLQFVRKNNNNLSKTIPDNILFGQIYSFGFDHKFINDLEDCDFKKRIISDKKPIKIIIEAQKSSIDNLSSINFEGIAIPDKKTGGVIIIFRSYFDIENSLNNKFNINNYGIFKSLLFAGLDGYVFKIINNISIFPDDSVRAYNGYNFIDIIKSKPINNTTITIILKNISKQINNELLDNRSFICNNNNFSIPNDLSDGCWIMELSAAGFGDSQVQFISINNKKRSEITFFDINFAEKLSINCLHELPNQDLIDASDSIVSFKDIPTSIICDQNIYQFKMSINSISYELKERIMNKRSSKLIGIIYPENNNNKDNNNLYIDAVAIPYSKDGKENIEFQIKFQIKIDIRDDSDAKYNINNYGSKTIKFAGPDGYVILVAIIELLPDESIRPPGQYEFMEQILSHKKLINYEKIFIEFENILTQPLIKKNIELDKGIIDIGSSISDGGWIMTSLMIDSFPVVKKFVKYGNRYLQRPEEIELIRKSINIDLKQSNIIIPKGALMVHPSSNEVYVDVSLHTKTSTAYFGTFRSDQFIQLASFPNCPEKCEFKCTAFIIPGKMPNIVDKIDLQKGSYSNHDGAINKGLKVSEVVIVKEFIITKNSQILSPNFYDTGADKVKFRIIHKDVPVKDKPVSCTFTPKGITKPFIMKGRVTNTDGILVAVLPPGNINISVITETGTNITFDESRNDREIASTVKDRKPEVDITRLFESSVIAMIDIEHEKNRPILLLGDTSGSMGGPCEQGGTDIRIDILKKTFKSMFNSAIDKSLHIGLVAWSDIVEFFCSGVSGNRWQSNGTKNNDIRYTKESDKNNVMMWIDSLKADGGTRMQPAIEESMKMFPDAKDIYIICDGDVAPFTTSNIVDNNKVSWTNFISQYPSDVKFHFIALADQASSEMTKMCEIGRGNYTAANKKN